MAIRFIQRLCYLTLYLDILNRLRTLKSALQSINMMTIPPFNISYTNLPVLVAKLQDLITLHPDKNWQVLIKERQSARSVEQNARLWSLYTSIGNYLGYTAEEIHQLLGYKFLLEEKWIGRDKITRVKSTTKLSVKEMAEYQDKICAYAGNLGWSDDSGF